jgi:alanine transaminase
MGSKAEPLDVSNLNANVLKAEYAVRGAIAVKAAEYQKALRDGAELPFTKVLQCNIGELMIPFICLLSLIGWSDWVLLCSERLSCPSMSYYHRFPRKTK